MADLSQIKVLDTTYDIKDATAREGLQGKANSSHTHTTSDITDFPSIPTKVSDLQNDSGFITEDDIPSIPTKVSDLTNDSGFITEEDVPEPTFVATYNTTAFADIQEAIADGKCVKCDVSGYTYELVQTLSNKITFALTNNVGGTITQETVWVTSDDEWDVEGVNVAKAADIPSNVVSSTDITSILKVSALPENPDPNTLYLVVEEAAAASETEGA